MASADSDDDKNLPFTTSRALVIGIDDYGNGIPRLRTNTEDLAQREAFEAIEAIEARRAIRAVHVARERLDHGERDSAAMMTALRCYGQRVLSGHLCTWPRQATQVDVSSLAAALWKVADALDNIEGDAKA